MLITYLISFLSTRRGNVVLILVSQETVLLAQAAGVVEEPPALTFSPDLNDPCLLAHVDCDLKKLYRHVFDAQLCAVSLPFVNPHRQPLSHPDAVTDGGHVPGRRLCVVPSVFEGLRV